MLPTNAGTARFCAVRRLVIFVFGTAFLYLAILLPNGWYIPCIFRSMTGLRCPGCGITTLFYHLLKGRPQSAFHDNMGLIFLSPLILVTVFFELSVLFSGRHITRKLRWLEALLLILLLLWFVLRNIYDI